MHTVCIVEGGEVYSWGGGYSGKLGHGDEKDQYSPKRIDGLVGERVKEVSCGYNHTAVCTVDGKVFTFGSGFFGALGHGHRKKIFSPELVRALQERHIIEVQCSDKMTMALTSSGYVFTWGSDSYGNLGFGKSSLQYFTLPRLVEGLRDQNVVQIKDTF